jgi:hypothetical protein
VSKDGERIVRLMIQQITEAGDKPTSFTIRSGGPTWDFNVGAPFEIPGLTELPNKQALPKF